MQWVILWPGCMQQVRSRALAAAVCMVTAHLKEPSSEAASFRVDRPDVR